MMLPPSMPPWPTIPAQRYQAARSPILIQPPPDAQTGTPPQTQAAAGDAPQVMNTPPQIQRPVPLVKPVSPVFGPAVPEGTTNRGYWY